MLISKSIQTEEGKVVFQGEIEGVELDLVLTLGLLQLIKRGYIKPDYIQEKDIH